MCLLLQLTASASAGPAAIPVFVVVEPDANGAPGQAQPIVPAIVKLLARESGLDLVVRPLPWRRAQKMAADGEGLLYGAAPTVERARLFHFTAPLDDVNQWAVSTERFPLTFRRWEDLDGKVISILSGGRYGPGFEARRGKAFTVEQNATKMQDRLNMLRAGRVDAVLVASYLDAAGLERKLNCLFPGKIKLAVAGRPVDSEPIMIAVPRAGPLGRDFPALHAAAERLAAARALDHLREDGAPASGC